MFENQQKASGFRKQIARIKRWTKTQCTIASQTTGPKPWQTQRLRLRTEYKHLRNVTRKDWYFCVWVFMGPRKLHFANVWRLCLLVNLKTLRSPKSPCIKWRTLSKNSLTLLFFSFDFLLSLHYLLNRNVHRLCGFCYLTLTLMFPLSTVYTSWWLHVVPMIGF